MTLEEMFQALRGMSAKELEIQVAKEAEEELQTAVEGTLSRGETPEGKAWAPTKKGKRAYAHASSKLQTKAYGNVVRMTLSGPEVFGHFGFKGAEPRPMLPDAGAAMPASVQGALDRAATTVFDRIVKGEK